MGNDRKGVVVSETIACIFVGDNAYRDHVYRRVMNERSYGATAGDSFWMGYQEYDEIDPFAQYREPEERKPITAPAWREKIEKAKRDIEENNRMWSIRDAAESITDDEFDVWFNTITKGQNEHAINDG